MRVMGIDLSTKAGVAVTDAQGSILHAGVITYPNLIGQPRVNAIVGRILAVRELYQPDHIFMEDYAVQFINSALVSIELGSVLRFILWQEGFQFKLVSPTSLKKFVTGNGHAKKELMMLEVFKRWGYSASVNDEADAVALAQFGLAAHQCAVNCTKAMLTVVQDWGKVKAHPSKKPL